jgi:hypothetical protein
MHKRTHQHMYIWQWKICQHLHKGKHNSWTYLVALVSSIKQTILTCLYVKTIRVTNNKHINICRPRPTASGAREYVYIYIFIYLSYITILYSIQYTYDYNNWGCFIYPLDVVWRQLWEVDAFTLGMWDESPVELVNIETAASSRPITIVDTQIKPTMINIRQHTVR